MRLGSVLDELSVVVTGPDGGTWPLPHPVFGALELARDPRRGRDVLAQWSLEDVDIVWR